MSIEKAIPHRSPFLLVDEIVSIDGNTIRTRKKVDADDPVFKGHFPHFPIWPGVLVTEALLQTGAILIAQQSAMNKNCVPALTRLNNAKYKHMVRPGDTIEMEVTLKEKLANAWFMQGTAKVGGKTAVTLEFACTAIDLDALNAEAQR
jgi:3-hydroxyacyl-[acyl-carrier-protein] dehydratase